MSINLSLPNVPTLDVSSLPSASDVTGVVSDALVTAIENAGDAATVVVESARRRPRTAMAVAGAAIVMVLVAMILKRRRARPPLVATNERPRDIAAA
jgi:hypothetical protein